MKVNLCPEIVNDSCCHYSMDHRRRHHRLLHHYRLHRRRHQRQVRCHDHDSWRNDRVHNRALNCTLSSVEEENGSILFELIKSEDTHTHTHTKKLALKLLIYSLLLLLLRCLIIIEYVDIIS